MRVEGLPEKMGVIGGVGETEICEAVIKREQGRWRRGWGNSDGLEVGREGWCGGRK